MDKNSILFPHETIREYQDELIDAVIQAVDNGQNLVVHAPTGLGKTAATLGPCLTYAIDNNKTIFFLTSRQTQHHIAIKTLKDIKNKHGIEVKAVDIIGKKWMCPVPSVEKTSTQDFAEYCKNVREDEKCEFYQNTKNKTKLTMKSKETLSELNQKTPLDCEEVVKICSEKRICPYEITLLLSNGANVVIADYFHIFNKKIRDNFFGKTEKTLEDSIIIVDEAHNLPNRIKDLASSKISNLTIKRAIIEAKKFHYEDLLKELVDFQDALNNLSKVLKKNEEILLTKDEFIKEINKIKDYDDLIAELELAAINIREQQKNSYIGAVSNFLERWKDKDEGFARILSMTELKTKEPLITLSYKCLDPSIISSEVINSSHSTILMSGTLIPTNMYVEVLGIQNSKELVLKSAFPKENRLNLIIKGVTTKFESRNEEQYKKISKICSNITNKVPGNSVLFFPSYYLLNEINKYLAFECQKTMIFEQPNMTKQDKVEILQLFKKNKENGAVLLAVIGGSFGEGIDLPGDYLKCVCILGLPLSAPDLETKSLIDYYDKKFGKGWEYGYIGPGFNKALQAAGRCIRTEKDRGVIVFLDERYSWPRYKQYFPKDWDIETTEDYNTKIIRFFEK